MTALFNLPATATVGSVERVSVPALPTYAHPFVVAARATWARWRALEAHGLDVSCFEYESHEQCQPEEGEKDDLHWLAWGNGDPRGWNEDMQAWKETRLIRFEPGLDSRYETAVVEIT